MKTIAEVLSPEQDKRAEDWMNLHVLHVMKLIEGCDGVIFPPSLSEDKCDPRIWKPNHWMWYAEAKTNEKNLKK